MRKHIKTFLVVLISIVVLLGAGLILRPSPLAFLVLQAEGIRSAGTWEDDPKNWHRAFNEEPSVGVKVIHSKYWKSNHFTEEHIYYFEVEATPKWKDDFLKRRAVKVISSSNAWSFQESFHCDLNPHWFAPNSVEKYEIWDKPPYHGSIWIDKTNGHIFFYESQV